MPTPAHLRMYLAENAFLEAVHVPVFVNGAGLPVAIRVPADAALGGDVKDVPVGAGPRTGSTCAATDDAGRAALQRTLALLDKGEETGLRAPGER